MEEGFLWKFARSKFELRYFPNPRLRHPNSWARHVTGNSAQFREMKTREGSCEKVTLRSLTESPQFSQVETEKDFSPHYASNYRKLPRRKGTARPRFGQLIRSRGCQLFFIIEKSDILLQELSCLSRSMHRHRYE
jgi:hypothetical protein